MLSEENVRSFVPWLLRGGDGCDTEGAEGKKTSCWSCETEEDQSGSEVVNKAGCSPSGATLQDAAETRDLQLRRDAALQQTQP